MSEEKIPRWVRDIDIATVDGGRIVDTVAAYNALATRCEQAEADFATAQAQVVALRNLWKHMEACSENTPDDVLGAANKMNELESACREIGAL